MADLVNAAKSGSKRDTLEALRDVAALSKRLMEVMNEIDALPRQKAESPLAKAKNGS